MQSHGRSLGSLSQSKGCLMMPDAVKCADCGFLGLRCTDTNIKLIEAELQFRQTGEVPPRGDGAGYDAFPVCFPGACIFREETSSAAKQIAEVLAKERKCDSFTRWKQGHSPKEHWEMLDRQWMLEFQAKREDEFRRWQRDADQADKQWHETQAQADKEWRESQAKEERQWRERQERLSATHHRWEIGILGFAAMVVALVSALIQAGWIQKP